MDIKTLAKLSGVNLFTIRAWEKRYQALKPSRSETGRRVYEQGDLERLRLLSNLVEGGKPIRTIASRSDEELKSLWVESEMQFASDMNGVKFDELIEAVKSYDLQKLKLELKEFVSKHTSVEFCLEVILPLMKQVEKLIIQGEWDVSHEHFLSSYIGSILKEIFYKSANAEKKLNKKILVTSLNGDYHEIGLLIAAILLKERYEVFYLGASLPRESILIAYENIGFEIVFIGPAKIPETMLAEKISDYLIDLRKKLPIKCGIIYGDQVKKIDGVSFKSNINDLI